MIPRQFQQRFPAAFDKLKIGKKSIFMGNAGKLFPAIVVINEASPLFETMSLVRSSPVRWL